jgi:hypothetical protein
MSSKWRFFRVFLSIRLRHVRLQERVHAVVLRFRLVFQLDGRRRDVDGTVENIARENLILRRPVHAHDDEDDGGIYYLSCLLRFSSVYIA